MLAMPRASGPPASLFARADAETTRPAHPFVSKPPFRTTSSPFLPRELQTRDQTPCGRAAPAAWSRYSAAVATLPGFQKLPAKACEPLPLPHGPVALECRHPGSRHGRSPPAPVLLYKLSAPRPILPRDITTPPQIERPEPPHLFCFPPYPLPTVSAAAWAHRRQNGIGHRSPPFILPSLPLDPVKLTLRPIACPRDYSKQCLRLLPPSLCLIAGFAPVVAGIRGHLPRVGHVTLVTPVPTARLTVLQSAVDEFHLLARPRGMDDKWTPNKPIAIMIKWALNKPNVRLPLSSPNATSARHVGLTS